MPFTLRNILLILFLIYCVLAATLSGDPFEVQELKKEIEKQQMRIETIERTYHRNNRTIINEKEIPMKLHEDYAVIRMPLSQFNKMKSNFDESEVVVIETTDRQLKLQKSQTSILDNVIEDLFPNHSFNLKKDN